MQITVKVPFYEYTINQRFFIIKVHLRESKKALTFFSNFLFSVREVLEDGVSLVAVDPEAGNKLVGFRLAYTIARFKQSFSIPVANRNT